MPRRSGKAGVGRAKAPAQAEVPARRSCIAITKAGGPCTATPLSTAPYCFWHAPADVVPESLKEDTRRLGMLSSRVPVPSELAPKVELATRAGITAYIEGCMALLLAGYISPPTAQALIAGANA